MGKSKEVKTNAMRILERNKIPYKEYTYECDEFVDALKWQTHSDSHMSCFIRHWSRLETAEIILCL